MKVDRFRDMDNQVLNTLDIKNGGGYEQFENLRGFWMSVSKRLRVVLHGLGDPKGELVYTPFDNQTGVGNVKEYNDDRRF